jgi:hypothetical protein
MQYHFLLISNTANQSNQALIVDLDHDHFFKNRPRLKCKMAFAIAASIFLPLQTSSFTPNSPALALALLSTLLVLPEPHKSNNFFIFHTYPLLSKHPIAQFAFVKPQTYRSTQFSSPLSFPVLNLVALPPRLGLPLLRLLPKPITAFTKRGCVLIPEAVHAMLTFVPAFP